MARRTVLPMIVGETIRPRRSTVASYPASTPNPVHLGRPDRESGVGVKILAVFLGLAVAMMAVVGLVLLAATLHARDDARRAASKVTAAGSQTSMPGMETSAAT